MKRPDLAPNRRAMPTLLGTALLFLITALPLAAQTRKRHRVQTSRVQITRMGYEPISITLERGTPARITFLRTTEDTCATEVVFADYGIRKELPLNQPVVVSFTPQTAGEFSFTCGMGMNRGKLLIR